MRYTAAFAAFMSLMSFGVTSCSNSVAESQTESPQTIARTEPTKENKLPTVILPRPADTTFEDVLSEYQAINLRLERVAAPLRLANKSLCPKTIRDPGFTIHRLEDYPKGVQPIAEALMGLRPGGVFVRNVRPGTSAERERIASGDEIIAVNEHDISQKQSMTPYNNAVLRNGFDSVLSKVKIRTPQGRDYVARIRPDTACDIPVTVVSSENINGHTDGVDVVMTSALMKSVPDDTNLALVIAHEMAHIIASHVEFEPAQDLELEADRMALVLMARSGYDVEAAVAYWDNAAHPHEGGQDWESSHPSTQARYENFRDELTRIKAHQDKHGSLDTLGFN